jgi:hypothetical protein
MQSHLRLQSDATTVGCQLESACLIDIPDFGGFLGRIAGSVEKMADAKPEQDADEITLDAPHKADR